VIGERPYVAHHARQIDAGPRSLVVDTEPATLVAGDDDEAEIHAVAVAVDVQHVDRAAVVQRDAIPDQRERPALPMRRLNLRQPGREPRVYLGRADRPTRALVERRNEPPLEIRVQHPRPRALYLPRDGVVVPLVRGDGVGRAQMVGQDREREIGRAAPPVAPRHPRRAVDDQVAQRVGRAVLRVDDDRRLGPRLRLVRIAAIDRYYRSFCAWQSACAWLSTASRCKYLSAASPRLAIYRSAWGRPKEGADHIDALT